MTDEEIENTGDEICQRLTTECGLGTFEHRREGLKTSLFLAEHRSHPRLQIPWLALDIDDVADLTPAVDGAIGLLSDGGGDVVIRRAGSLLIAVRKPIEPFPS